MKKNSVSSGRIPSVKLISEFNDKDDAIMARRADAYAIRIANKKGVKK